MRVRPTAIIDAARRHFDSIDVQAAVAGALRNLSELDEIAADIASLGGIESLIDAGALVTGLNNKQVAAHLLPKLPAAMEGVVYLEHGGHKKIMLRSGATMDLERCGVPKERRFSFYDQVHTTGMDIPQAAGARAVLTLGKDLVFRDYAQAAYRMRQP